MSNTLGDLPKDIPAPSIRPIDNVAIHKICSGQVILDLATAVKELVENALDANATSIDVRFRELGVESFEVSDNGSGISSADFATLAQKHCTSKLSKFEDLTRISSFGFRGEALSSLCSMGIVAITTSRAPPLAHKLSFDSHGMVLSNTPIARDRGTTVTVMKFMNSLPVRHAQFTKHAKREFGKCLEVLRAYALISLNAKISVYNCSKNDRSPVFLHVPSPTLLSSFQALYPTFPAKSYSFSVHLYDIQLLLSTKSRSSPDRIFIYINSRPIDSPKLHKALISIYQFHYPYQYPILVLSMVASPQNFDCNVTPDKRTVLLSEEDNLLQGLRTEIDKILQEGCNVGLLKGVSNTLTQSVEEEEKLSSSQGDPRQSSSLNTLKSHLFLKENSTANAQHIRTMIRSRVQLEPVGELQQKRPITLPNYLQLQTNSKRTRSDSSITAFPSVSPKSPSKDSTNLFGSAASEKLRKMKKLIYNYFSDDNVRKYADELWMDCRKHRTMQGQPFHRFRLEKHYSTNELELITNEDRSFAHLNLAKSHFLEMQVVGQFNLGFILTFLDNRLFIIDQHASDEKSNFEKLKKSKLETQRLIKPLDIHLSPAQEVIVSEFKDEFLANGFDVEIRKDNNEGRIRVWSVPITKRGCLGERDLEELIHLISASPTSRHMCKQLNAHFASIACRTSIMIGTALEKGHMESIVKNLAGLDQPWNCPHGRPTIRLLDCDLSKMECRAVARTKDWSIDMKKWKNRQKSS